MPEREIASVDAEVRLDQFLVQTWPVLSRQVVRQMIVSGDVLVNDQPARKAGQYVQPGDVVKAAVPNIEGHAPDFVLPSMPLPILYEDEVLLVVDKPSGIVLRPTRQARLDTMAQRVTELYPALAHVGGAERAGIVMRVEAESSGALLVAKDEDTYRALQRSVKHEQVETTYSVLVEGRLTGEEVIDQPIGNVKRARQRLNVAREGRPAQTFYRGQRYYKDEGRDYSLLEVRPLTSRLHQIRVHLSWYGFPLVGDQVYGSRFQPLLTDRLFMHLSVLTFKHPLTDQMVRVESPLPPELRSILRYLTRPKAH